MFALRKLACLTAIVVAYPAACQAALITFSGLDGGGSGRVVPPTYQPLLNTYSGTSSNGNFDPTPLPYSDGANIGVTMTWDGSSALAYHATNGGVTDHTNDGAGVVFYDNGNSSMTVTFSAPVTIPDFFFAYYSNGPANPIFDGYTNASDSSPVVTVNGTYPGGNYNWQETGFGSVPLQKIVLHANDGAYLQIDDITVKAVPEPASLAMFSLGAIGLFFAARRRRSA